MKKILKPSTKLGKYSVVFQSVYIIGLTLSIVLVKLLKILDFNDRWWDISVAFIFPSSIISFVLGIMSVKKKKENSSLVYFSIVIGFLTILFIIFHGFFTSD